MEGELFEVKSPLNGVFYRAPYPGASPFVAIGDHVAGDSTVCILECMKMHNEVTAEVEGVVEEILAEDGQEVAVDQVIMKVRMA